jgi:hypothetical protein
MTIKKWLKAAQGSALALSLCLFSPHAHADAGIKVGVLTCHEASGWGFIVTSTRDLRCVFSPNSGESFHYLGHISKFGVDLGYQGAAVIIWTVFAPTTNVNPADLAGNYAGATANVAIGIGAGANVLIGGSNQSISLQPVSIEGGTGLNVAAGIGSIGLQYQQPQVP